MRLTEEFKGTYWDKMDLNYGQSNISQIIDKLGQSEDIEDEYHITDNEDLRRRLDLADKYSELSRQLGIDLITFFKIIKAEKVYLKGYGYFTVLNYRFDAENPKYWHLYVGTVSNGYVLYLIDYGKTWALTKEELKDE